ncbi:MULTISPECIES: universal stress protein [Paraburkholderia]|uniref:Universal stress protein n=1 Tax=Paraburkholderia podalyriae TaxID=1938811 RepID=A0ABR7Q3E9_9BURK|nr:universal stress protein [Paraburkholderia podalyriae]
MFKHLLVPTDGSALSEAAIQMAVILASESGAKVTGLHVMPEFHVFAYGTEMLADTEEQFIRVNQQHADDFLAAVTRAAAQVGVECETVAATRAHPYEAIISTAAQRNCDLIVMASHGRSGVRALLIGSETQKVLTHSAIPVLVVRQSTQTGVGREVESGTPSTTSKSSSPQGYIIGRTSLAVAPVRASSPAPVLPRGRQR